MSLTGRLYKISEQELQDVIKKKKDNFDHLSDSIDLSYFALDYLEIINSYSGFDKKNVRQILEGLHSIDVDEGYLGYSKAREVSEIKSNTVDKLNENIFVAYLDRAEQENHLLGKYYSSQAENRESLVRYFSNIKRIYEEATSERKCLLYRIG